MNDDNIKQNLLLGAAFVAMALIAPYAFANNISGQDNIGQINNGNGNVNNAGGIVGSGNNSPSLSSSAVAAPVTVNNNTATGGAGGKAAAKASSHSAAVSGSSADSFNLNTAKQQQTNEGNSLSVQQNYAAQKRNPVNTAFAAPLVAADDTCMGSSSVGGQGVGFGLSVGSTWQDADCVRRKDARELHNMGYKAAGIALMCQNENVAKAMATAGTPCAGHDLAPAAGSSVSTAKESVVTAPRWNIRAIDRY